MKNNEKYHLHHPNEKDAHSPNTNGNHHNHNHGHIDYENLQSKSINILKFVIILTFGFALIEAMGGYLFNSLALISDAAHMFTDSSSLLIALVMAYISRIPADYNHSYGHGRAEVLGALFNSLFMIAVIGGIFYAAIQKFQNPNEVQAIPMLIVASIGLIINIGVFFILQKDNHNINIKAAIIHVLGDLLGSVAAIASAIIIYFTKWNIVDPILSVLVCLILIPSTYILLKRSMHILLEGVPEGVDFYSVGKKLENTPQVKAVHDLHIWTLDSKNLALSAHIIVEDINRWDETLNACEKMLYHDFGIVHTTLQPESIDTHNHVNNILETNQYKKEKHAVHSHTDTEHEHIQCEHRKKN